MPNCCGSSTQCNCVVTGGSGIAISGAGTMAAPYVVTGYVGGANIPLTEANSGTAYTINGPTRGEMRLRLILTGNVTFTLTGGTDNEVCAVQLNLIQDGVGSRTVTAWPGNVDWGINGPPILSTVPGKMDMVYLTTDDGGLAWQGALIGNGYTSPIAPSAPVLGGSVVSNDAVLTWTQGAANGSTVVQNKIYRGTVSGSLTLLATIAANTTYTDTSPTSSGTTYYYKVSAVNGVGEGAQSNEVALVPDLIVIASDNFNRANDPGTTPTDGLIGDITPVGTKTWINVLAAGAWSVVSNAVAATSANRKAGIDAGVSNCSVAVDIINTAAMSNQGIFFRWVDSSNFCTAILDPGGIYVQKTIAGVQTNVAGPLGGAIASGADMRLSVVLSGSSVIVKQDGVTKVTTTVADAAVLTATKHGIMVGGTFSDVTFDNFEVTVP